jgi:hypothetical protein
MPRPSSISQADVNRVMKVAAKHNMTVRVLPDGSVMIVPKPEPADAPVDYQGDIRL